MAEAGNDPFATNCRHNFKKTGSGQLAGDHGSHPIDNNSGLDLHFCGESPHNFFNRRFTEIGSIFKAFSQQRQPLT